MITDGVLANAANFNAAFESKNKSIRSVSSSGDLLETDQIVNASASSGNITLTLPNALLVSGKIFIVRRTDQTLSNSVNISTAGFDTFIASDGTTPTTVRLMTRGESIQVMSIGSGYVVLNRYVPSEWVQYTPSWTTPGASIGNGTINGMWRRVGGSIDLNITIIMGSTTTFGIVTYYFSIPSGLTLNFTKTALGADSDDQICGYGLILDAATTRYFVRVVPEDSTTLKLHFMIETGGNPTMNNEVKSTSPITFANGDKITFKASFPITNWEG